MIFNLRFTGQPFRYTYELEMGERREIKWTVYNYSIKHANIKDNRLALLGRSHIFKSVLNDYDDIIC